jgi:S1-C subfamily serine protease
MAADYSGLDLSRSEIETIKLFESSKDSVVNITNVGLQRNSVSMAVEQVPRGTGSGFVWDNSGHIVTNFHVIQVKKLSLKLPLRHNSVVTVAASNACFDFTCIYMRLCFSE